MSTNGQHQPGPFLARLRGKVELLIAAWGRLRWALLCQLQNMMTMVVYHWVGKVRSVRWPRSLCFIDYKRFCVNLDRS